MSLRQKTIIIIGLTFLGLMALLYTISRLIVLDGFSELEKKSTAQNVIRATNVIYDELAGLDSTAHDWASWDDTYTFVDDANQAYIEDNLTDSSLIALRVNLMVFINPSGQIVFGKAVDLLKQQEAPLPQNLLAQLSPDNILLHHPDIHNNISGIILLPEAPLLVVSRAILTNEDQGPSRGTLIIGRYLDGTEIQRLGELAHLSLHLDRLDNPHLPAHVQLAQAAISAETPVFIQPLNAQTIAGYSLLKNIEEEPVLMVRVELPREIYQQGQASTAYLMWSLVMVGLVFGATTLLLLEKQVLSRLIGLSERVSQIGASGDLTERIPITERDELSDLTQAINTMLGSLEQSEHALREQTRRNELILQTSLDGFMVLDLKGRLREVNSAFCHILGRSQEDLLGHALCNLEVQNCSIATTQERVETVMKAGADRFETRYHCQDGQEVNVEVSLNLAEFGQDQFLFGFVRDITDRKRAETENSQRQRELVLLNQIIATAAASSEARVILETACRELALFFNLPLTAAFLCNEQHQTAEVVVGHQAEGRLVAACKTIPMGDSSLLQSRLASGAPLFVADAGRDPELTMLCDWITQQHIVSLLILPLIIEGEVAGCLNLAATEVRHFQADEISLAGRVADQVAMTLARVRLAQTQQRLSAAIEQSVESVVITDTKGTILYVNPAFELISGYSRTEALGQTPRLLKSGQQPESFYQELWQTLAAGRVWRGRMINKKKDGTLYTVDKIIIPVRDEQGQVVSYVAVGDDVTDKLNLENQLRQAQKMEGIGRLAGGIAHDFNNLLTVINGYSEILLQRHANFSDAVRQEIEQIKQAGQRAATLTAQLLAFSRKQVLQPQILDLNHLVANMDKMLSRLIGEDIDLRTVLAPSLGRVKADPGQIEQVLVNLAVNARDAMPGGGKLTIETANVNFDSDYVRHHVEVTAGEYVMIAVSDTGVGMSADIKAHLFEPFFTTKARGKGTGLGLATCFGIVKQNGGHIWVYSEPGQGTTFKIYLPHLSVEVKPVAEETRLKNLPRGTEIILLVEDAPTVRALVARILQQQGYTVLEAANGLNALQLVQTQPELQFQLLLTDVIMPDMGGQALVDRLTVERPDLKVLFMSGYTDTSLTHQDVRLQTLAFLQKPFTAAKLLGKVREVLDAPVAQTTANGQPTVSSQ